MAPGRRPPTRLQEPIVMLTGAGVSTASGIPDFRSPGGIWERFDPDRFTIDAFHRDPAAFWTLRRALTEEMGILDARPNDAHRAIAHGVDAGRVAHVITQNIDGLHQAAGVPEDRVLEVHGNARQCVCMACGTKEPSRDVLARLEDGTAPRCGSPGCTGLMKPDVVLFGELVHHMDAAATLARGAGTLLVAGTSLRVHPVAALPREALDQGAELVICNRDPTPYDDRAVQVLRGPVEKSLRHLLA